MPIQAKLAVSEPGDALEREADRIAERVTESSASGADAGVSIGVARGAQRASRDDGVAAASAGVTDYVAASRGGGSRLPSDARGFFESRLGRNLSNVRVHDDVAAAHAADAVDARAFTAGEDVYFARGEYSPHTSSGRKLIAHELVHALQQAPTATASSSGARSAPPAAIQRDTGHAHAKSPMTAERAWANAHPAGMSGYAEDLVRLWNFGIDSDKLKPEHRSSLLRMAKQWLKLFQHFPGHIKIYGYASPSGSEGGNIDLSHRRISSVMDFLQKNGFPGDLISDTRGRGSHSPLPSTEIAPGDAPERIGWKMAVNRSVDIMVDFGSEETPREVEKVPGTEEETLREVGRLPEETLQEVGKIPGMKSKGGEPSTSPTRPSKR
jgi:outer membrane protein OmpA-like peptidoglycan-associated protein